MIKDPNPTTEQLKAFKVQVNRGSEVRPETLGTPPKLDQLYAGSETFSPQLLLFKFLVACCSDFF